MNDSNKEGVKPGIYNKDALTLQDLFNTIRNNSEITKSGSILSFTGIVRNTSKDGRPVEAMVIDAYDEMANATINEICDEIKERKGIIDVIIVHFKGNFNLSEDLVHVVVASSHREEGFEALRDAVEKYKKQLAVWKKDIFQDGDHKWGYEK